MQYIAGKGKRKLFSVFLGEPGEDSRSKILV